MIFDLIAGLNEASGGSVWTPADLFKNGEVGFWLDGSDYSTMSQSSASQVDVTASGQPVGSWRNKLTGQTIAFNFVTSNAASRPVTKTTSGKMSIVYDGVDDQLITPEGGAVPGQAFSVFMGQKTGAVASAGRAYYGASGSAVSIQNQADRTIFVQALEQTLSSTELYSITTPNVLGLLASVGTTPITVRVNSIAKTGTVPTTGIVGSNIRIAGSPTLYSEISQVVFINRVLTASEITLLETFIGSKQ